MRFRDIPVIFWPYQIYKFVIVLPMLALSTMILVLIGMVIAAITGETKASIVGVLWARFNSFITPMLVRVMGCEHIDPGQSYVIVANHQSLYDIYVIYGWLPIDFKWVMKAELRTVPFLGFFCEKIGHTFVDRKNTAAAIASIEAAKSRITGGTSVMFFPEGTWSADGELLEFKKGAFRFALDLQLPILPITIMGTPTVLPADTMALFPGRACMIIHEPIAIDGYNENSMPELMMRAKNAVQAGLVINQ